MLTDDFVVAGTCSENLYGTSETLYRPDLSPEDLFETVAQVLLASMDRDALSGWGGALWRENIFYDLILRTFCVINLSYDFFIFDFVAYRRRAHHHCGRNHYSHAESEARLNDLSLSSL